MTSDVERRCVINHVESTSEVGRTASRGISGGGDGSGKVRRGRHQKHSVCLECSVICAGQCTRQILPFRVEHVTIVTLEPITEEREDLVGLAHGGHAGFVAHATVHGTYETRHVGP